ncbi:MAG: hypothetical protein LBK41_08970 [Clostridiales bacterium]|nr:hypothetical protein [Clostridiales bacterium]
MGFYAENPDSGADAARRLRLSEHRLRQTKASFLTAATGGSARFSEPPAL